MRIIKKKLSQIIPYENNPRNNDHAVKSVAESIRQCGYVSPIVIDECNVILAGHTRYKALSLLGYDTVECVVASGLDPEQKRKFRILDNKLGELATWDTEALSIELEGIDFGVLNLEWDMPEPVSQENEVEPLDLNDPVAPVSARAELLHCPRCGFEFEVKK